MNVNLFVEELTTYLTDECTGVLTADDTGDNKITLVVQSLPLAETIAALQSVERFFVTHFPGTERALKISRGLWFSWSEEAKSRLPNLDEIERNYVDLDDQLTTFRNKSHCIFFGFDHASDKGSLKDFHLVSEELLWRRVLKQRYRKWVNRIAEQLNDQDERATVALEAFLDTVEKFSAGRLLRVAGFFDQIFANKPDTVRDVVAECHFRLSDWGALPLLDVPIGRNAPRTQALINLGHSFASYALFVSMTERNKAFKKIDNAQNGGMNGLQEAFALPGPMTPGDVSYSTAAEYLDDVRLFIRINDRNALARLQQWDATALLSVLAKSEKKEKSTAKATTLKGYSDVVFLQAIKLTVERFISDYGSAVEPENVSTITLRLNRYCPDGEYPDQEIRHLLGGIVGSVIPETLVFPWVQHGIKVQLEDLDDIPPGAARAIARVEFTVAIKSDLDSDFEEQQFIWPIPATHPERLRLVFAEIALRLLLSVPQPRLPAFHIGGFDELFSAIDEPDAHRLLMLGMSDFKIFNVLDATASQPLYADLVLSCNALTSRYKQHLESIFSDGFYAANAKIYHVIRAYSDVVEKVNSQGAGTEYLLPCLYRAFLTVRNTDVSSTPYLNAAVALPISPFVLELSSARAVYLRDGFNEVMAELFETGKGATEQRWQRLIELAELRRPIVALIADVNRSLTTASQSFGLTHLIGVADTHSLPVASQSLMRQDNFEDEDLGQKLQPSGRSRIYENLICDYQVLHNHSHDQLSLLFTNISEIDVVLAGVDRWLKVYLDDTLEQTTPFHLTIKIITTGIATTNAVNMLVAWKDAWAEVNFQRLRRCVIQIGHRHATTPSELENLLRDEQSLRFDLGIISHFLDDKHEGDQLEPVVPFDAVQGSILRQFPLAEYPRPIRQLSAQSQRQMSISNRRVQMASNHTEIAARLKSPHTPPLQEHAVVTQIDFTPWKETIALLHKKSVWVSCVDRHIDSNLISAATAGSVDQDRRVVGFSCGLGNYGELNQTISTEVSDLATLTRSIAAGLRQRLHALNKEQAELAAHNVIKAACEIPGLSLVRAVGHDEYIRDVIGYSLVSQLFGRRPTSILQALIPLDSFRHWFSDRKDPNIPDLLFMSAKVVNGKLEIDATIVESKFALESNEHTVTAFAQASAGLRQLVRIFAPQDSPIKSAVFERKYWWAQLHRALSSRAVVSLASADYLVLCGALDRLGEGDFTIAWRAIATTFWTDRSDVEVSETFMGSVDVDLAQPLPEKFGVYQLQFGTEAIVKLLTQNNPVPLIVPGTPLILAAKGLPGAQQMVAEWSSMSPAQTHVQATADFVTDSPPLNTPVSLVIGLPNETLVDSSRRSAGAQLGIPQYETVASTTLSVELPRQLGKTSHNTVTHPVQSVPTVPAAPASTPLSTHTPAVVRLLLGNDNRGQEIFWEYGDPDLENRHMLIFGASGSGKTYAIQCLLLEMAKQRHHAAIIDYTDGFLPSKLDPVFVERAAPHTHVLVQQPFPINPFQRLSREEPGIGQLLEQPHNVASRVADVFCSVYNVGDVQRGALTRQIEHGLSSPTHFGLEELLHALEADSNAPPTLALKISELVKQKPFSGEQGSGWKQIFEGNSLMHILQLVNISKDMQRLIAEFALWDFFAYAARNGSKDIPLPVVLDEVQNLDHRSDRAIDKLLREGRKFGVGMILATQTISNFDKEERSRLFQCANKLFFKPAETERKEFAQILADVSPTRNRDEWIVELGKLGKGECWAIGPHRTTDGRPMRRDPVKVKIASLEARLQE